jgi:hypothetical protein
MTVHLFILFVLNHFFRDFPFRDFSFRDFSIHSLFLLFSLICSDLIKSIPDLCKITILNLTIDLSNNAVNPSSTLVRRLLNKMSKMNTIRLSFDYLICLMKSPLITQILTKQISSLCIQFYNRLPVIEDMIRIVNIFSSNLHFLYFEIYFNFSTDDVYHILPFLFSEEWKKFYTFHFRMLSRQQQPSTKFCDLFKQRLEQYFNVECERRKAISKIMEYRITANEFSISF